MKFAPNSLVLETLSFWLGLAVSDHFPLIIVNKSIKETENLLLFFRVRSNFISLMNTKTCILLFIR